MNLAKELGFQVQEELEVTKGIVETLARKANLAAIDEEQKALINALSDRLEGLQVMTTEVQQRYRMDDGFTKTIQEHDKYEKLFEMSPTGCFITDTQGSIQEANQVAAKLFNVSQEFLVNKPLTVFFETAKIKIFLDLLDELSQSKGQQNLDLQIVIYPRVKPCFQGLLSVARVYNLDEKLIGLQWTIQDITMIKYQETERAYDAIKVKERQLEVRERNLELGESQLVWSELQKLSRLKSDFLNSVSHELRTPLCNIKMGLFSIVKHVNNNSQSEKLLSILNKECQREIDLIEKVLLQVKEEEFVENSLPALQMVQLSEWLDELSEPFHSLAKSKDLQLVIHTEENLRPIIVIVPSLQTIVIELLSNAFKFSPTHSQITIQIREGDNSCATRPTQSISITNHGPRILNSHLQNIFETFYRVPTHDPYEHGGVGLGLPLALKLTQQLGGTLQAKSTAQATTFTIEVPQQSRAILDIDNATENFEFVFGVIKDNPISLQNDCQV